MEISFTPKEISIGDIHQEIIFVRQDGTKHIDSVVIPYDDGVINNLELENRINILYNYVVDKSNQNNINWAE